MIILEPIERTNWEKGGAETHRQAFLGAAAAFTEGVAPETSGVAVVQSSAMTVTDMKSVTRTSRVTCTSTVTRIHHSGVFFHLA